MATNDKEKKFKKGDWIRIFYKDAHITKECRRKSTFVHIREDFVFIPNLPYQRVKIYALLNLNNHVTYNLSRGKFLIEKVKCIRLATQKEMLKTPLKHIIK